MISVFEKRENCCGCTACRHVCPNNAIEMVPDEEGFLYPSINQKLCIDCGICKKVCAFQNGYDILNNLKSPNVYAVKHKNENIRMNSTSGGVFTAISDYVLGNNGIVFGVAFDDKMNVVHKMAKTKEDRDMFKGSKYVQSDLKNSYKEIKQMLKDGSEVLFTGTPCQTAGLARFLSSINTEKLILCDIICHGTPSPLMWMEHIKNLEARANQRILKYNFRDKSIGWRDSNVIVDFVNKCFKNNSLVRTYINLYYSHNITRTSCYNCKYTNLHRPSDITIADFWGIENYMPDFDDNKGISLVLVNSAKGERIFENISQNLNMRESNTVDCLQPQLQYPSRPSPNRDKFWRDYETYGYNYVIKKYAGYNLKALCKRTLKRILDNIGLLSVVRANEKARTKRVP